MDVLSRILDRLNMPIPRYTGVLGSVAATGVVLVLLSIAMVNMVDTVVIERAAAQDRLNAFLRATLAVSRIVGNAGDDIRDTAAVKDAFEDILELRPGLRRLSVFDLTEEAATLVASTDSDRAPAALSDHERIEVLAGRAVTQFDDTRGDRGWVITAPIHVNNQVVGALRGKYSIAKYDRLIEQERTIVKALAVAMVVLTCLVFFVLIRVQIHRPVSLLLHAMRQAERGDLMSLAPLVGSSDIREVAGQYNRMLDRIGEAVTEKERLLKEVQHFNVTLKQNVADATNELSRTHALLMDARLQAERAGKLAALGELSAAVAHELGNPLNAISGHLQMLITDTNPDARERHLTVIQSEIGRMTEILRHILESTRVRVDRVSVDLNAVIHEVVAVIFPSLVEHRVTLKTSLPEGIPPVSADRIAIHGVVMNLVTNAIQAMPKGGRLEISTARSSQEPIGGTMVLAGSPGLESGAVRLTVRDTGQGIPPDHLKLIFEPFFTTREAERGTGLGLAICHRTISSVGGRLVVQSVVGQGTTFTIDLPLWNHRGGGGKSND